MLLSHKGCVVEWACSVAEAVPKAAESSFDLYVLDNWWLANGRGLDACRRLRELDPATPILSCSANANPRDIKQALEAGAQDYITLPDFQNNLQEHIAAILRMGELRNLEAKHEAIRATKEHVQELLAAVESGVAQAAADFSEAQRMLLKANALLVFIKAGGTRANFERVWPEALREAVDAA